MPKKIDLEISLNERGCHIVISHKPDKHGYISLKRNGKMKFLHRTIYEETNGTIPDGLIVRHKCDTPSCINPEHLELGTHADNNRDTRERGRYYNGNQKGEGNGNNELTEDDVRQIRSDKINTNTALGKKYGVHHSTISAIRLWKIWKHIS